MAYYYDPWFLRLRRDILFGEVFGKGEGLYFLLKLLLGCLNFVFIAIKFSFFITGSVMFIQSISGIAMIL